jgi:hypothetical protein
LEFSSSSGFLSHLCGGELLDFAAFGYM